MQEQEYWIPEHVREYLKKNGYSTNAMENMEGHIRTWNEWMSAIGDFYSYHDVDGFGRAYEVHRRSLKPAMRVCTEWGSLLLNDKTQVVCENQKCTDWLETWMNETGFIAQAQACLVRSFGLGTGAWALWVDTFDKKIRLRCYDARMVVPLTWDEDGVSECALVTRCFDKGKPIDQLQIHRKGILGYQICTTCFDEAGNETHPIDILSSYETYSEEPTFALIKPAIDNTRVDMSPYGQSVFADALGAIQAVDLAFDAMFNEVDVSKMRVFLSDVLFETDRDGNKSGKKIAIPFGKQDATVFRKVMSTEDTIQEFAPALRTQEQERALRIALQMLGDLCGFGISYFDFDNSGYVKTATEVSSDNSALMRNIRRHENLLENSLVTVCKSVLACARRIGIELPNEGDVSVTFDDSIITDTAAEKTQDMAEVAAGLMQRWEYRMRWYGEDESVAKKNAQESYDASREVCSINKVGSSTSASAGTSASGNATSE